jgi:hypothetical protein
MERFLSDRFQEWLFSARLCRFFLAVDEDWSNMARPTLRQIAPLINRFGT